MKSRILPILLIIFSLCLQTFGYTQTNSNHVKVKGYYRSDGTYVKPHYKTAPNSTNRDNFTTRGNTNPYTGEPGYIIPDSSPNTSTNSTNSSYSSNSSYQIYNYTSTSNWSSSYYEEKPIYTTTNNANLMERKSTSSAIQVVIPANSNVKVINSFFGDWWEVSYNGKTGYLNSNLLSFNSDSNTTNNHNSGWSNSFYDDKPTYTTTRNAYLREHKSTSSAIQVVIPANSNVKVINSFFGDWWEVSYNGKTGYLNSNLLSFNSDPSTTNNRNSSWSNSFYDDKPTYTTTGNANLREHKSTSSAIQVVIPANSNVKVINSFFGDWWEVSYNGKTGYLNSNLLSFNSDRSTTNNHNSSWSNSFYDDKPTYTTTRNANLREHKSTSSAIQVVIPANSNVKVINSFFGDWWEVYYKGKTGYIPSSLLTK